MPADSASRTSDRRIEPGGTGSASAVAVGVAVGSGVGVFASGVADEPHPRTKQSKRTRGAMPRTLHNAGRKGNFSDTAFTELARPGYLRAAAKRMERRRSLLLATGVIAIATTAPAAVVRGKIANAEKLIPAVYADIAKAEHRYTWREPSPTVKPEFRALSANPSRDICIAAVSQAASGPHAPIQITVTGGHTVFTTIAVSPQTKILFVNHDPFPHRLYEVGDPGFKEQDMAPGTPRDWTASGAGTYEFRDRMFPTLRFFVVVVEGLVDIVYPEHNGSFKFPNLPSGDYFLRAYFDGKPVGQQVQAVATHGNVELREPLAL